MAIVTRPRRWLPCAALLLACGTTSQGEPNGSGMGGALNASGGASGSAGLGSTAGSAGEQVGMSGGSTGLAAGGQAGTAPGGAAGMQAGGSAGDPTAGSSGASMGGASAGEGGMPSTAGMGGEGGGGGAPPVNDPFGPASCLPIFEEVCKPTINFENQDPGNSGNFDAVMQDVEAEMQDAICTMCSILYRSPDDLPRTHETVNFVIDDHAGVAYAGGNSIHLSTGHIQNYGTPASAYVEFKGVMVHEAVHLYQVNGGASDGALIEGVADFVRVRAGYYGPGRCGGGDSWDGAYTISGCFFSWLAGPSEYHEQHYLGSDLDIGYRINLIMSEGKAAVQQEIEDSFGVGIQELWTSYKGDY